MYRSFLRFLKNWTLPIAILTGFISYEAYSHLHIFDATRPYAPAFVAFVQPVLIFSMLFLSFCKIDARRILPKKKHLWLLLIQAGVFIVGAIILHYITDPLFGVILQAGMLCFICPTATSACVITSKLGGDAVDITTYTVIINILAAIIIPTFVPLFHQMPNETFSASFLLILKKVFPMLILPLLAAQCCRRFCPTFTQKLTSTPDLPFYLWAIALSIAIAVTSRAISHSQASLQLLCAIAVISLISCATQFGLGNWIGRKNHSRISTAQSLGQKNTVFAIWVGYTFMDPLSSIAGGFYSVWHNLYNTWQLKQMRNHDTSK